MPVRHRQWLALSSTHLHCTSCGKPSFSIRSDSSSKTFLSSSVIASIMFLDAFVRSVNHPGVRVSALSNPMIDAIFTNTLSWRVHQTISVKQYRHPGFLTGVFRTCQMFLNHLKRICNNDNQLSQHFTNTCNTLLSVYPFHHCLDWLLFLPSG